MDRNLQELIGSFRDVPIVRIGDYNYFVHPLSDGIPKMDPDLLDSASRCVIDLLPDPSEYDLLLTVESMGIPITTAVSSIILKPYSTVRKRCYGLPGEAIADQRTGYSDSRLHLNLPEEKGRVVILDDVLSTGGTIRSVSEAVKRAGWKTICAVLLFNKMGDGRERLSGELGYPIRTVLDLEYSNDRFLAVPSGNVK